MTESVAISDPAILIRINLLFQPGMSDVALYEATRGVWRIGPRRAGAKFAFTVFNGIIREVYRIDSWQPAGTFPYNTRPADHVLIPNRWEFVGEKASDEIRAGYGPNFTSFAAIAAQQTFQNPNRPTPTCTHAQWRVPHTTRRTPCCQSHHSLPSAPQKFPSVARPEQS